MTAAAAASTPARRRWSIRRRVLLGTVAATVVAMLLVSAVSLLTVRTLLVQRSDDQLDTATRVLAARLTDAGGTVKEEAIVRLVPQSMLLAGVADGKVVLTVTGSRETTRAATELAAVGVDKAAAARTPADETASDGTPADDAGNASANATSSVWSGTVDGVRVRARAVATPGLVVVLTQAGQSVTVDQMVIAVDVSDDVEVVRTMVLVELAAMAVLLVMVIVTVRWVVARGLAPLRMLAAQAGAVADGSRDGVSTDLPNDESAVLAQALDDALRRRATAEARLRSFVADASHELRTPLTVVHGWADLYLNGAVDPAGVDDAMVRIEAESTRMRRMVDQMAALATGDGHTRFTPEPVDLRVVVAEVVDDTAVVAPARAVVTTGASGSVVVMGDRDALAQVVHNLVGNAVRHTAATCTITIGLEVEAGARAGGGEAVLTVSDDGAGIAPEVLDRVFERYAHGHATGGSGLGLAVVRAIVTAHDGQVAVSTASTGTTVTVRLPCAPAVR